MGGVVAEGRGAQWGGEGGGSLSEQVFSFVSFVSWIRDTVIYFAFFVEVLFLCSVAFGRGLFFRRGGPLLVAGGGNRGGLVVSKLPRLVWWGGRRGRVVGGRAPRKGCTPVSNEHRGH